MVTAPLPTVAPTTVCRHCQVSLGGLGAKLPLLNTPLFWMKQINSCQGQLTFLVNSTPTSSHPPNQKIDRRNSRTCRKNDKFKFWINQNVGYTKQKYPKGSWIYGTGTKKRGLFCLIKQEAPMESVYCRVMYSCSIFTFTWTNLLHIKVFRVNSHVSLLIDTLQ